jgi:hypothetical protein
MVLEYIPRHHLTMHSAVIYLIVGNDTSHIYPVPYHFALSPPTCRQEKASPV